MLTNRNIWLKTNNFKNNDSEFFKRLNIMNDTTDTLFILKIEDSIYSNIQMKVF